MSLYRAPYADRWERKSLDWAMAQIAQLNADSARKSQQLAAIAGGRFVVLEPTPAAPNP